MTVQVSLALGEFAGELGGGGAGEAPPSSCESGVTLAAGKGVRVGLSKKAEGCGLLAFPEAGATRPSVLLKGILRVHCTCPLPRAVIA